MTHRFLIVALAAVLCLAEDGPNVRLDQLFAEWNKLDSPGASVAVIRDGQVIFRKGYGSTNLEYATPITPETVLGT